jgi:hypothetical protein
MLHCNIAGGSHVPIAPSGLSAFQAWSHFTFAYVQMTASAAEVITRRSQRIALGAMTPPEAAAMVLEKSTAFAASAERALVAAAKGRDPVSIATEALKPYGAKTRSNVRKLRGS